MRIVIQRVLEGKCLIHNQVYSAINKGYVLLVGFCDDDKEELVSKLAQKVLDLRLFEDHEGKMNLGIQDIKGDILAISQFTLYADCKKGRRPSFTKALNPVVASEYYDQFVAYLKTSNLVVKTGVFKEDMKIQLVNDGPCTILLDSKEL